MLKIPKSKTSVLTLTFIIFITAPFINAYGLYRDLVNGEFSPEADAIAIPIVGFFVFWLLFAPFVWAFIVWAVWKYPPGASLFGFNREQPLLSFAWSAIFAFLFFTALISTVQSLFNQHFIESIQAFSAAYLALVFRAAIVFSD
jgi:hypothetical protein